ncbi:hypothetical protein TEQG_06178 [Trichophyton equinum CBS 127.97]|uniref:Uncharacterized protein n=1 Tax=Trichophyton equinum (strain ATCC MYA-4606 / CBS 127.97) TaxID=559882 RepID=F2PZF1_TRIEC|nr:hypothetical protein TEQG_06178 [Trichophyton equinum CBS 127.97]
MSVEVVIVNPASKMEKDEEELSEEQIQSLLLEAETRLKKASGSSSSKQDGDGGVVSLATGQEVGDSASRPKLVPESAKKLAETIHTVNTACQEKESGRFKRKYAEIQEAKTSGKKAYYKKLKAKRARPMK